MTALWFDQIAEVQTGALELYSLRRGVEKFAAGVGPARAGLGGSWWIECRCDWFLGRPAVAARVRTDREGTEGRHLRLQPGLVIPF